jgi:ligand-binding sensor domain-containing protein/very-short-patch-repair endonuclease/serine phosphatase RsbU (regulator of sigma subunit)
MKRFFLRCLLPIACCLLPTCLFSQRNNFQTYSLEQGLPQATIYCIIQDNRGYLWLGTDGGGLCRFDGIGFKTYGKKEGFRGQSIRSLIQDSKGRIWAGTKDEGIIVYDGLKFTSITKKNGLSGTAILCMYEDEKGTVWAGTDDGGLNKITPLSSGRGAGGEVDSFRIQVINQEKGLSNNSVFDIHKDKEGHIWLATLGGIDVVTPLFRGRGVGGEVDSFSIDQFRGGREIPSDYILSIEEDSEGALWFGTLEDGVFRIAPQSKNSSTNFKLDVLSRKVTTFNQSNGFNAKKIWGIYKTSNNEMWFASVENGIIRKRNATLPSDANSKNNFENYSDQEGLPANQVLCIFEDKEKNIWIGTSGNGLCKFMGDVFSHYSEKDGLPSNSIQGIDQDSAGNFWLATSGGGLAQLDLRSGKPVTKNFTVKDGLPGNSMLAVSAGKISYNKSIWGVCNDAGIAKFNGKTFTNFSETQGLLDNSAYSILVDKNGIVWIGTLEGISKFDGQKFLNISMETMKIDAKGVNAIIQDKAGNLWFGTGGGLAKYSGDGSIVTFDEVEGLMHKEIKALAEDPFGNIWIGTNNGGLYRLDVFTDNKQKIQLIANDSLLSSNSVRAIIFLDEKTTGGSGKEMVVGTDKGIDKITFDDKGKILKIRNYNATDGFMGVECNDNAMYRDAAGNIWIGTVKGLTRFNPAAEIQNHNEPQTHITNVKLYFKEVDWRAKGVGSVLPWFNLPQSLQLSNNDNHLTFDYSAISLGNAQKVKYRYMLEGADEEWSPDRKETSVTFSGLSPGTYIFKVIAAGANGVWNTQPAEFRFTINPPWYRTFSAYLLYFILLAGGTYSFIKYRERVLLKEKKILEDKVQERTAEVVKQKEELVLQNEIIEEKNKDITDSINYAEKIQRAILPDPEKIKKALPESFILFGPRDIVSGDFFWYAEVKAPQPPEGGPDDEFGYQTADPMLYKLLKEFVKENRSVPTEAENIFWELVREKKLGYKFRRQHIIGQYIADFVCLQKKLIIEIDGLIHEAPDHKTSDQQRTQYLNKIGFSVLRFTNNEIIVNPEGVIDKVLTELKSRTSLLPPSGGGGAVILLAAADCTGHGVPGAFMSMINTSLLNESVNEKKILQPNEILNEVRKGIITALKQTGASGEQKDGMDVAIVSLTPALSKVEGAVRLQYAGANNSMYIIRKDSFPPLGGGGGVLEEIEPDPMPVAISDRRGDFTNKELELQKGDTFYIFTDGYADQFGGPKGKKFKYSQFKQLLISIQDKTMQQQHDILHQTMVDWKGELEQIDDILVIGVRI